VPIKQDLSSIEVQDPYLTELHYIYTKDSKGNHNGGVMNVVNQHLDGYPIEQVYMTFCEPNMIKGPHMHTGMKIDRFYCIQGKASIRCRNEKTGVFFLFELEALDKQLLVIPPYNSHQIIESNGEECIILSMPTEGYNPDQPYNQIETEY
jgi:dTDP-4-dehydrorhamnose 3,5-epimerase-like enzyme